MCGPLRRVATPRDRWRFPARLVQGVRRNRRWRRYVRGVMRQPAEVTGKGAERFGTGPAVVPGQDLTETAGPVRDRAVADLAASDRQLGNGQREAAGGRLAHLHL